jgi:transposase InsO family protein
MSAAGAASAWNARRRRSCGTARPPSSPSPFRCCGFQTSTLTWWVLLPCSAEGFTHLFIIIDRSIRWCGAVPLRSTTADNCAATLISGWVAWFGVPAVLTSDRGVQFSLVVWGSFTAKLGVQHAMTTAYHPQSNGMVERLHRRIKDALRARLSTAAWPQHLLWVLLGLRSCPWEDSGLSSAELVYGSPLTLPSVVVAGQERPAKYFVELFHSRLSSFSPLPTQQRAVGGGSSKLHSARYVFVRAPPGLTPAYRGPFRVVESGEKVFKVQLGTRVEVVSVDRLKPYLGSESVAAKLPHRATRAASWCCSSSRGSSLEGAVLSLKYS